MRKRQHGAETAVPHLLARMNRGVRGKQGNLRNVADNIYSRGGLFQNPVDRIPHQRRQQKNGRQAERKQNAECSKESGRGAGLFLLVFLLFHKAAFFSDSDNVHRNWILSSFFIFSLKKISSPGSFPAETPKERKARVNRIGHE